MTRSKFQAPPELIEKYKAYLAQTHPLSTQKRKISSLRSFFSWQKNDGRIGENPLDKESSLSGTSDQLAGNQSAVAESYETPETDTRQTALLAQNVFHQHLKPDKLIKFSLVGSGALTTLALAFLVAKSPSTQFVALKSLASAAIETAKDTGKLVGLSGGAQGVEVTPSPSPSLSGTSDQLAGNQSAVAESYETPETDTRQTANRQLTPDKLKSEITLQTSPLSDGDITLAPDGQGQVLIRSGTTSQNSLDIRNANLTTGALIYGNVGNNGSNYDFIRFTNGIDEILHFSVDAVGNTYIGGKLDAGSLELRGDADIAGELFAKGNITSAKSINAQNILTSGITRINKDGALTNITGYAQSSGNFNIAQLASDSASITRKKVSSSGDLLTLSLDESGVPSTIADTLVLERRAFPADGYALFIKEGNSLFDGNLTVRENLTVNGSATLGDGDGSLSFNLPDNTDDALDIQQGTNNYINISTSDATPVVTLDLPVAGSSSTTANLFTSNVTKTINLGTGTAADTINIGTGGTTADTINIGTAATANTIAIGSSASTTVSITDDNWSITAAGAATFGSTLDVTGISTFVANVNANGGLDVDDAFVIADGGALTSSQSVTLNGTTFDLNSTTVTIADTDISFDGASTTFTTTGAFTLTPGGAVLIGDGGDTLQINSSDWDVSTAGAFTNIDSVANTSADLALLTTTSGNITLTTAATTGLVNVLTGNLKVGDGSPDVSLDSEDAYIEGTLEADGAVRFDGNTTLGDSNTADTLTGNLLTTSITSGATTQTAFSLATASLTTGESLDITATYAPTAGGTQSAIDINLTNSPSTTANTLRVLDIGLTDAGTLANTVYGAYIDVTTANANDTTYAAYFSGGNVGIGDTTPDAPLEILSTTTPQFIISNADTTQDARFSVSTTGDLTLTFTGTGTTEQLVLADTQTINIGGSGSTDVAYNVIGDATTNASASVDSDDDLYIEGNLEVDGLARFDGSVDIGDTASDTLTITAVVDSNFLADASDTRDIGSSSVRWRNGYFTTVDATTLTGTVSGGSTTSASWTINSDNATANAEIASLAFETGTNTFNAVMQWNASGDAGRQTGYDNNNLFNYPISIFSQVSGAEQTFTGGSLFNYGQSATHAITQASAFVGLDADFSSNITVPNTSSGNQTGALVTLKDGGASATAIGFQTAGTFDYGLDIGGTPGTAEIRLSNSETIDNLTNNQINLNLGASGTLLLTSTTTSTISNSAGILTLDPTTGLAITLTDNNTDALDIQESTNNYLNINTTDSSENISFGNATTNPSYSFLGTGTLTVTGNCVTGDTLLKRRRRTRRRQGYGGQGKSGTKGDALRGWDDPAFADDSDEWEDVRIDEVNPGDEVLSLNDKTGEFEWHQVEKTMYKGVQEVFELLTATGKSIKTTANHPYLVLKNTAATKKSAEKGVTTNWVKVSELKIGELIATAGDGLPDEAEGVVWEKIRAIYRTGRKQTWDIEVENTHNFVAGHYVNRKTGKALTEEQEAAYYSYLNHQKTASTAVLVHPTDSLNNDWPDNLASNITQDDQFVKSTPLLLSQILGMDVNENDIVYGGIVAHNTTLTGDLAVNGGDITSTSATLTLGGSITTLNCTDCIDFDDLENTLDIDETTTINTTATTTNPLSYLADSISTGTALIVSADALSTGTALDVSSTSTAGGASGTSKLLNLARSGANANLAHTAYGVYSAVTNTNATSGTNIAGYFSASGATTANYGLIVENGNVGIGTATPSQTLHVVGQCVTGDSILVTEDGRQIRVDEVKEGQKVYTLNQTTGTFVPAQVNALLDMGVRPVFRLTTASGKQIRTTGNHPYLVNLKTQNSKLKTIEYDSPIKGAGWVKVTNLRVGNEIAVAGGLSAPFADRTAEESKHQDESNNYQSSSHLSSVQNIVKFSNGYDISSSLTAKYNAIVQSKNLVVKSAQDTETPIAKNQAADRLIKNPANTFNTNFNSTTVEWDEIVAIEYSGEEQVWDLSIEGTHNFVANGIVAHNTYINSSTATGTALDVDANSLTTGTGLDVSSTSTTGGASGTSKVLNIARSGANANLAHTAYGVYSAVTNTNATSGTNIAGYFSASGATTANYGLIVENGNVGIGTASPQHPLQVYGTLKVGGAVNQATGTIALGDDLTTSTNVGIYRGTLAGAVGGGNVLNIAGYDGVNIRTGNNTFASQTTVLTATTGGNVGIGDTGPDSLLDILSATTGTNLLITNTNATDTDVTVGFALTEGTNSFTIGVDDSDSDKFKISTSALGAANADRLNISSTDIVFNEDSQDLDFRIESDGNANMFVLDGGSNVVAIGGAVDANVLFGVKGTFSPASGEAYGILAQPTVNAVAASNANIAVIAGTLGEAASGNHPRLTGLSVQAPTITGGVATVSDTATLYVTGAMSATVSGANYALWVDAGTSRFDGVIDAQSDISDSTGNLTLNDAVDISGDLAVNGGDLTSTATTFNLLNATVTTLNIGSAATAIRLGAAGYNAGIGGAVNSNVKTYWQGTFTGGTTTYGHYHGTSLTGTAGNDIIGVILNDTLIEAGSGVHSRIAGLVVQPVITAGVATATDALGIDVVTFAAASGTTTATGIRVAAPTGATNNYAATFTGGNVGIGDTGPDSLLDILSATTGTNLLITNTNATDTDVTVGFALTEGTNSFTIGVDDSDSDKFKISTTALGTGDVLTLDSRTTTSGVSALTLATGTAPTIASAATAYFNSSTFTPGTVNFSGSTQITSTGTSANNAILYNQPTINRTDAASSLTIDQASNLFINGATIASHATVGQTETITTSAALRIGAGSSLAGTRGVVTNGYGLYVDAPTGATNNYAATFATGNVGIGTTSPATRLDILGNNPVLSLQHSGLNTFTDIVAGASGNVKSAIDFDTDSSGTFAIRGKTGANRGNASSGTEFLSILSGGNVGIGDTSPTEATLVVGSAGGGNIYATFTTANTETLCWDAAGASLITDCSSLRKFKENIADLSLPGIETVMKLKPRAFDWIGKEEGIRHDLGFVAEEMEEIEPLLASYNYDEEGVLHLNGVKYERLTALLTLAIQELNSKIDSQVAYQSARLDATNISIESQRAQLSALSDQLASDSSKLKPFNIDSSGNVGIGTTNPLAALDVTGNVTFQIPNSFTIKNSLGQNIFSIDASGSAKLAGTITSEAGAFDVSEDYPVEDESIEAGDLVSISHQPFDFAQGSAEPVEAQKTTLADGSLTVHTSGESTSDSSEKNLTQNSSDVNSQNVEVTGIEPARTDLTNQTPHQSTPTSTATIPYVEKSSKQYQNSLLGIVSTKPGVRLSQTHLPGEAETTTSSHLKGVATRPVALSGRVPVKVSTENGSIRPGDSLTTSSTPGVAMRATKPGPVVGKALESFPASQGDAFGGYGKIMVFVNVSWHDPSIYIADNGQVEIRTGGEDQVIDLGNRPVGTSSLDYSPTDPVPSASSGFGKLLVKGNLEVTGDATISGELSADTITSNIIYADEIIARKATFGDLIAQDISADTITRADLNTIEDKLSALESRLASNGNEASIVESQAVTSPNNVTETGIVTENRPPTSIADIEDLLRSVELDNELIANSSEWDANADANITSDTSGTSGTFGPIRDGLVTFDTFNVLGNLATVGNLSVGSDLVLGNRPVGTSSLDYSPTDPVPSAYIDTLSAPLSIQSLAAQPLFIMGDRIQIDTNGNVVFKNNVTIEGILAANTISPTAGHDLTFDLSNTSEVNGSDTSEVGASGFGNLIVKGIDGAPVASIDASGSATLRKIVIASSNTSEVNGSDTSEVGPGEIQSNATAGQAVLPANNMSLIIRTSQVNDNTLVYVTPTSSTGNQVLYVKAKVAGDPSTSSGQGYFIVGVDNPVNQDIQFNYWIIELQQ
ncbi:tail fiber domain-containing protein [Candidatus Microgenomates bacterium]|nr:tail fiber domain-containing protein [Candidatus Microgenomates bacterium]